jgi:hypothetical protein
MQKKHSETYFETQASALDFVEVEMQKLGIQVQYPNSIWTEHVAYGTTVNYNLHLRNRTGNPMRKWLNISLYRMDSGRYELNWYLA